MSQRADVSSQFLDRTAFFVEAPSRLHFGLLAFSGSERTYGGVGVMVDRPQVRIGLYAAAAFSTSDVHAERAEAFARRWSSQRQMPLPAFRLQVETAPPLHAGLGVGTQLGMSVGAGLDAAAGLPSAAPAELAKVVGRGRRSAVGTYGFALGGLIIERGKRAPSEISELDCHIDLPAAWRFVIIRPPAPRGLSGSIETSAFDDLAEMPSETTQQLTREVREHLLPAAARGHFEAFAESVYRFGYFAGMSFATAQGGPYNGPELTRTVEQVRELGVTGVGQSSWGPSLFALFPSHAAAETFCRQFRRQALPDTDVLITTVANRGARVVGVDNPVEARHTSSHN